MFYGHIMVVSELHRNFQSACVAPYLRSTGVTYSTMSALPTVMTCSPEDNDQVVSLNVHAYRC